MSILWNMASILMNVAFFINIGANTKKNGIVYGIGDGNIIYCKIVS